MTDSHHPAPGPSPASPLPVPSPARRAHWTPAKQRIFLAALLECGSIAAAARAAGMSRSSAHRLRARLAGTPFVRIWDQALAAHAQRLADPFGPAATQARR
ncbi:LysR family transcriptional regulator [Sphingomonas sp. PB2P19]|uniref:LysR family transcriptional regulator n=1 Tax=Sphingomonas rhamnosi TaxID=3096156 RepID=UPI002FC6CBDF